MSSVIEVLPYFFFFFLNRVPTFFCLYTTTNKRSFVGAHRGQVACAEWFGGKATVAYTSIRFL